MHRIMRFHFKRIAYIVGIFIAFFFIIALSLQNVSITQVIYPPKRGVPSLFDNDVIADKQAASLMEGVEASKKQLLWTDYQQHHEAVNTNTNVIWPVKHKQWIDRIVNQMNYIPKSYRSDGRLVTIFVSGGLGELPNGQKKFLGDKCPVNRCWLTDSSVQKNKADALLFQNDYYVESNYRRPKNQIWILFLLESPLNSMDLSAVSNKINWTATYRSDSTIVTPYEKFVHYDNFTKLPSKPLRNYAEGKTSQVAWFVSNCNAGNKRWEYVLELKKYLNVDIYGACGTHQCSRFDKQKCDTILNKQYKFYLAFENSNCKYYITEKFYWNALMNDIVPVVMGARKEDYAAVSPPGSFIHVDDFPDAGALAKYLLKLDQNPDLYNNYFLWKGTGKFIDTKFWCRMCGMLHGVGESNSVRWYNSVEKWWRNDRVCTSNRWDDHDDRIQGKDWVDLGFRRS